MVWIMNGKEAESEAGRPERRLLPCNRQEMMEAMELDMNKKGKI